MARTEIIGLHEMMNAEAKSKGNVFCVKDEYAAAWETFRDDPNISNARSLLEVAPMLIDYFEGCSPGGNFYESNQYLEKHGLRK